MEEWTIILMNIFGLFLYTDMPYENYNLEDLDAELLMPSKNSCMMVIF